MMGRRDRRRARRRARSQRAQPTQEPIPGPRGAMAARAAHLMAAGLPLKLVFQARGGTTVTVDLEEACLCLVLEPAWDQASSTLSPTPNLVNHRVLWHLSPFDVRNKRDP